MWLIFATALLLSVVGAIISRPIYSCSIDCPRDYPTDEDQCQDCCDECCRKKYPNVWLHCTDECGTMC